MIDPSIWRRAAPAMALVSTMTSLMLAGLLLGSWLDRWFDSGPLFTAGLTFLGFGVGIRRLLNFLTPKPPDDSPPNPAS